MGSIHGLEKRNAERTAVYRKVAMEKTIVQNYDELYALQDRVLGIVFSEETPFYLTGGTALHRFYCNARYSDDLDFFMNGQPYFYDEVKEIIYRLRKYFEIETVINTKDFLRIKIGQLKIDFVNDRVYKYGISNKIRDFAVDNVFNILANKLTAVIGRDEEKDVFDIVSVCLMYEFDWKMILKAAHQKEYFDDCTLIERLKTFPLWWLENLKLIKPMPITETLISTLCQDISHKDKNSVFGIKYE